MVAWGQRLKIIHHSSMEHMCRSHLIEFDLKWDHQLSVYAGFSDKDNLSDIIIADIQVKCRQMGEESEINRHIE